MNEDRVKLTVEDHVAHLRLNRPAERNGIDHEMALALAEAVAAVHADVNARALLISGEGPAFCVGGDLKFLAPKVATLDEEFQTMIGSWHDTLPRFSELPIPVVTAIHGGTAGGGLGLVWCADFVIAADNTKIATGFVELGLPGDGGSSWHLPRLVGLRRAQELILDKPRARRQDGARVGPGEPGGHEGRADAGGERARQAAGDALAHLDLALEGAPARDLRQLLPRAAASGEARDDVRRRAGRRDARFARLRRQGEAEVSRSTEAVTLMSTPPQERREALVKRIGPWVPSTLHAVFDRAAALYADRPLLLGDERSFTYREVCSWSEELAQGLLRRGVKPGDRVALVMANYAELVAVKLAISRVGAVAVPLNFLYRRDELAFVLRQSRCHYLVTMNSFRGLDYLAALDELAPSWPTSPSATFPELRSVFVFLNENPAAGGSRPRPGMVLLDELRVRDATREPLPVVSPDDISDIFYTSGSTGTPRGAVMRHDRLLRSGYAAAVTRALPDGRRTLFALPLYHCFAYVEGLLATPWVGGAVVLQVAFSPDGYLGGIERHRAEEILAVPTMMVALLEHPGRASYDLSSLDCIFSAAAPTPRWVWDRVREELGVTELVTGWGMTEVGAGLTITQPEDPIELHVTTVGRVKHCGDAGIAADLSVFVEVGTVDPLSGEHLPDGADGEIVVRGVSFMDGYWERPEETAATLVDGWLRTGDLGRVLPSGYLQLSGRTKELYKSGGELVMPKEIEELLSAVPGVSQVFAVGVPDDRWGEMGCAVVVRDAGFTGEPVTAEALLSLCRERLARFKVPKHIVFLAVAELPTTATGKVQKFRLVTQVTEKLKPPSV